jgi:hypothetical protein
MKIHPVGAELVHSDRAIRAVAQTDGQRHITKLTVAFRNFSKAPKKIKLA